VHAGFSGMRAFVARKKSRCKLIGNRFVIPHDTIPSNVTKHAKKKKKDDQHGHKLMKQIILYVNNSNGQNT